MPATPDGPIAIYYEHPDWFRPLFAELDRRGVSYERVDASTHRSVRNVGNADAILVVAGGKDGYVGRDGQAVGGSGGHGPPGAA